MTDTLVVRLDIVGVSDFFLWVMLAVCGLVIIAMFGGRHRG